MKLIFDKKQNKTFVSFSVTAPMFLLFSLLLAPLVFAEEAAFPLYGSIEYPVNGASLTLGKTIPLAFTVAARPELFKGDVECNVILFLNETFVLMQRFHRQTSAEQQSFISGTFDLGELNLEDGNYSVNLQFYDEAGTQIQGVGDEHIIRLRLKSKPFIYMVQAYDEIDAGDRVSDQSDVVQLIWGNPPTFKNPPWVQVWAPNTTANEGRNKVLEVAQSLGDYLYFIQCDDDAEVVEVINFGKNTGNGWRTFEKYLLEWEPAVGFVRNEERETNAAEEVQVKFHFDTIFTAFHREAIAYMMPLETRWDNESWWYASCPLWLVARALFNNHRLQFNGLQVRNHAHTVYPKVNNWTVPIQWMMPALRLPELQLLDLNRRIFPPEYLGGAVPMKRQGPYHPPVSKYDPCHPFFVDKRRNANFLHDGSILACVHSPEYNKDYLHYRREQEYVAFAQRMMLQQEEKIGALEAQVEQLQDQLVAILQKVGNATGLFDPSPAIALLSNLGSKDKKE